MRNLRSISRSLFIVSRTGTGPRHVTQDNRNHHQEGNRPAVVVNALCRDFDGHGPGPLCLDQSPVGETHRYAFHQGADHRTLAGEHAVGRCPRRHWRRCRYVLDYAAKIAGARVYAFEPDAINYAELNKNIFVSGLHGQVTAYCMAMSDENRVDRLLLGGFAEGLSHHDFGEHTLKRGQDTSTLRS